MKRDPLPTTRKSPAKIELKVVQIGNSHDREFVSSLATRILELKPGVSGGPATVVDFRGSYEDYLESESAALAAA